MANFDKEIDLSGLHCPIPIFKTKEALNDMADGEVLHIISDDPASVSNFANFVKIFSSAYNGASSLELLESRQEGKAYYYRIKKCSKP